MASDPELRAHQKWLGYVQPVGLVVSPPALLAAQAHVNQNILPDHSKFIEFVNEIVLNPDENPVSAITNFPACLREVFGWEAGDLIGGPDAEPLTDSLEVTLTDYNETLRPTYAVKEIEPEEGGSPWLLLVESLPTGRDLDAILSTEETRWPASPQMRFERLLRENKVPIGLLLNGTQLRLVYAPRGETSGHITFSVQHMSEVAGRPIFAALHMLLSADRLFALPRNQRLPAILAESRRYQSLVSTQLSEQVLNALYELLRGFQAANEQSRGELLQAALKENPNHVYAGLITVLLRLVFVLYAEDRGLLSTDRVYVNQYSVGGLFERLRDDHNRYPDTMDQRYGAWPQLLTLFRLIYSGVRHGDLKLPPREGGLFDPDRYKFLEGRPYRESQQDDVKIDPPMVSDGVIYRVLNDLLILDGERLSYRTLDVEEIGSVYQTVMGFTVEVAQSPSVAIVGKRKHKGQVPAPAIINLSELLETKPADRIKWLREQTEQKVTGEAEKSVKAAGSIEDLLAALDKKIARQSTPNVVARGAMILQPTDERRRSGSHYTPRSFTEPIVRKALEPILKRLGDHANPDQILNLKICDMAAGSAAFLVETCRQLGDELVAAWHHHGERPTVPADETEELLAYRLIAQRCIYGVDRNPMAVDLAKLSLWLATLAKDHPFTFLDHAICCGDSLVGLTRRQIADFHWKEEKTRAFGQEMIEKRIQTAAAYRREILDAGDSVLPELKRQKLALADNALEQVRFAANCVVAAFFSADKDSGRNAERDRLLERFSRFVMKFDVLAAPDDAVETLQSGKYPVLPFHWEVEFPEVFGRENPGFDAIVGNPPFLGGKRISTVHGDRYKHFLLATQVGTNGNADLAARFFRWAFARVRRAGTVGLIATNTISQGDTRRSGLQWICKNGGVIYACKKRCRWPGDVAVVVSIIHIAREQYQNGRTLDGRTVERISAFLFHAGSDEDPKTLKKNLGMSFIGCDIKGQGFLFADDDPDATPTREYHRLVKQSEANLQIIMPYMSGEEINESPIHAPQRWVINFGTRELEECKQWPDLLRIVETKVRPERSKKSKELAEWPWWRFWRPREELFNALVGKTHVFALSRINSWVSIARVPTDVVYSEAVVVIPLCTMSAFAVLQSQFHELWARFFSSTAIELLRYSPSNCFETFPFPEGFTANSNLEKIGQGYLEFRGVLMARTNEGMTKTYNRLHDPEEKSVDITRLRQLQRDMDLAVLGAYKWTDLHPPYEFFLDYEDDDDDADENLEQKKRRKPWRYRWPDDIRDEVLARLLKLNEERAEEERLSGQAANDVGKSEKKGKRNEKKKTVRGELFD